MTLEGEQHPVFFLLHRLTTILTSSRRRRFDLERAILSVRPRHFRYRKWQQRISPRFHETADNDSPVLRGLDVIQPLHQPMMKRTSTSHCYGFCLRSFGIGLCKKLSGHKYARMGARCNRRKDINSM